VSYSRAVAIGGAVFNQARKYGTEVRLDDMSQIQCTFAKSIKLMWLSAILETSNGNG